MPNQFKTGNLLPQAQVSTYEFDPERGLVIHGDYDGSSTKMAYLAWQDFVNQGIACTLKYAFGRATIHATDSTNTFTLDSWSIRGNDESLDPLLNPIIAQDLQFNSPDASEAIAAIRLHLSNNDSQDVAFGPDEDTPGDPALDGLYGGPTYNLFPFLQGGLTGFRNDADGEGYVLNHSTNISNQSQDNIADFATGQIYTTAQLLTEVQDTGLWNNPAPERLAFKIANLVQPKPKQNWMIGWFKSRSSEDTAANNRVNIVTQYTFGQFMSSLYSPYTA